MYILKTIAQKLKKRYFSLMATFYNFALKIETSWAKKVIKPILENQNNANMLPMMLLCMFGLFPDKKF